MKALLARLPLWVRKFINTTIVTFTASVLVMSLAQLHEAGFNALGVAFATAALKSAVENAGDFYAWVKDVLSIA